VKKPGRRRWILEWVLVLAVAVGLAVVLRTYVVQTYSIPSGSMIPTLMVGDRILVDKLSYHLHPVHRGDVVVFATPPKEIPILMVNDLVKRVIGLPGETISSGPHGEVLINGMVIDQPWLTASARADPGPPIKTQKIAAGTTGR
jgi:signal peptidase I